MLCTIKGCSNPLVIEGMCIDHLTQTVEDGRPESLVEEGCGVAGCVEPTRDGFCATHLAQFESLEVGTEIRSKVSARRVVSVPLAQIDFEDRTYRMHLSEEADAELARSIGSEGLLYEALLQRRKDGKYRIVAGWRRCLAIRELARASEGLSIPAKIVDGEPADLWRLAIAENFRREWVNAYEVGRLLRQLEKIDAPAGEILGMGPRQLRRYRSAYEQASPAVTAALERDRISLKHVMRLVPLPHAEQDRWLARVLDGSWSEDRLGAEIRRARKARENRSFESFLSDPKRFGVTITGSTQRGPSRVCFDCPSRAALRAFWRAFVEPTLG